MAVCGLSSSSQIDWGSQGSSWASPLKVSCARRGLKPKVIAVLPFSKSRGFSHSQHLRHVKAAVCMCRLCPVDPRCEVPLDCTDANAIQSLVDAATEYIQEHSPKFGRICDVLLAPGEDEEATDNTVRWPCPTPELHLALTLRYLPVDTGTALRRDVGFGCGSDSFIQLDAKKSRCRAAGA